MKKKDIKYLAASAVASMLGAMTGMFMMKFFGKKLDETEKKNDT